MFCILLIFILFNVSISYVTLGNENGMFTFPAGTDISNPSNFFVSGTIFLVKNVEFTNGFIHFIGNCTTPSVLANFIIIKNVTMIYNTTATDKIESIKIDLSCNTGSFVTIEDNSFIATGSCLGGLACMNNTILVTDVTSGSLRITGNTYGDTVFGIEGTQETKDNSMYTNGIIIHTSSLSVLEPLILPSVDFGAITFQRLARHILQNNKQISGSIYDVLILESIHSFGETCAGSCVGNTCNSCYLDPTRYTSNLKKGGVCFDDTLFDSWQTASRFCNEAYDAISIFPISYPVETITITRKNITFAKQNDVFIKGPSGGLFTLKPNPLLNHGSGAPATILEPIGHSVYLNATEITFMDIDFNIVSSFIFPFYGGILFSKDEGTEQIDSLTFIGCSFTTPFLISTALLFDSITIESTLKQLRYHRCILDNINFETTPNQLQRFEMIDSIIKRALNGALDIIVTDVFRIENVTCIMSSPDTTFESIIHIHDSTCMSENCTFEGNNVIYSNGALLYDFSVFELVNISGLFFRNHIDNNGCSGAIFGLEYRNISNIPCTIPEMNAIKQNNIDITGTVADIICDRDLPSEKQCLGLCLDLPPPLFCEVNPNFTISDFGFLHDKFDTVQKAISLCLSQPTQDIRIHKSVYLESNIQFIPPELTLQNELQLSAFDIENKPTIVGHSHTFTIASTYDFINISNINWFTQDFENTVVTTALIGITSVFNGHINSFLIEDCVVRSSIDPDDGLSVVLPDVDMLFNIITHGTILELRNVELYGSKLIGVRIIDFNQATNNVFTTFIFENVNGKMMRSMFIDLLGIHRILLDGVNCTTWCGGFDPSTEAIIRVVHKEVINIANKLIFLIEGMHVEITDALIQTDIGIATGVWIEHPPLSASFVDVFHIRGLISLGYKTGFRYVDIPEEVLQLVEEFGEIPIDEDAKRGMRETARYNTIKGTVYDVKNGHPFVDVILHPGNTCNDLCLTATAFACRVNKDFIPVSTPFFGTRRFHTIQKAIADCTVTTDPMLVLIMITSGNNHFENIYFNASKGIVLQGQLDGFLNPGISIIGKHVIKTGITEILAIKSLEFWIDNTVVDRTTPLFSVDIPLSFMNYNLHFENIIFFVDSGINFAPILDWNSGASSFQMKDCIADGTFFNLNDTDKGLFTIDFSTASMPDILIDDVQIGNTDGAALVFRHIGDGNLIMENSVFQRCAISDDVIHLHTCLFFGVSSTSTTIHMRENTITRESTFFQGKINGTYITGLWIHIDDILLLDNINGSIALAKNITTWAMSNNVGVGIRFEPVFFSPSFLLFPQLTQQNPLRKISFNNLGIVADFHDIVININDDDIMADQDITLRLYCSDGCPVDDTTGQLVTFGILFGFIILLILFLVFVCPFGIILFRGNTNFGFRDRNKVTRNMIQRKLRKQTKNNNNL